MIQVNSISKKQVKRLLSICLACVISYILLPTTTFAQSISGEYQSQIMFSPVRVIDIINPGIELTYNRQLSHRFSTAFSAAYMTDPLFSQKFERYSGYRFSFAPRYLGARQRKSAEFAGPEFVYYKTRFPAEVVSFNDSTGFHSDTFSIRKKMISINLLYGKQFYYNRFFIDLAFGLGIKFRHVQHFNRTLPPPSSKEPDILINSKAEMKNWTMNLPINFRLGYRF